VTVRAAIRPERTKSSDCVRFARCLTGWEAGVGIKGKFMEGHVLSCEADGLGMKSRLYVSETVSGPRPGALLSPDPASSDEIF